MIYKIFIFGAVIGILVIITRRLLKLSGKRFFYIKKLAKIDPTNQIKYKNISLKTGEKPLRKNSIPELNLSLQTAEKLFKENKFRDAEKIYLKIAALDPKNSKIYNRLGAIYLIQKNFQDAKDAFSEALKHDNKIASRHYNYGMACIELGEKEEARMALKKALKIENGNIKYTKLLDEISK